MAHLFYLLPLGVFSIRHWQTSGQLWRNKTSVLYQLGDACISRDVLWDEDYNIHSSDKVSWCTGLLVLKLAGQLKLRESED